MVRKARTDSRLGGCDTRKPHTLLWPQKSLKREKASSLARIIRNSESQETCCLGPNPKVTFEKTPQKPLSPLNKNARHPGAGSSEDCHRIVVLKKGMYF